LHFFASCAGAIVIPDDDVSPSNAHQDDIAPGQKATISRHDTAIAFNDEVPSACTYENAAIIWSGSHGNAINQTFDFAGSQSMLPNATILALLGIDNGTAANIDNDRPVPLALKFFA
jgi:hypothetical protein